MPHDEKSPMANTEIEHLRAANAEMLKVLRAIDVAAAEIEATDGPADDRAMWSAIYDARRRDNDASSWSSSGCGMTP
jgi:hypothetical protein